MSGDPRAQLLEIYAAALAAVHGRDRVRDWLAAHPVAGPVSLVAVGKAACAMARGAHEALGAAIVAALVVTKHGYGERLPWPVIEAGHPLPDERSLAAGQRLLDFAARAPRASTVLVLLSGGASALVEALPEGVDLAQLRALNDWLLGAGLDIVAMNRLRKRLSLIKGGRLAQRFYPRAVLCLAISDVPGDDPRVIGSGPLTADAGLAAPLDPAGLPERLRAALARAVPAPPVGDPSFRTVRVEIIATLADAKRAAADAARRVGYGACLHSEFIAGEAVECGTRLARQLLATAPGEVQIWGGETTVHLPPAPGRGGRNQGLALAAALELAGEEGVWLLAAGTDGSDGPTTDAGALVDGGTLARGADAGLEARAALAAADAGSFLEASGDLIQTGPTGTNVMDLVLGLRA
jgi:hydroxypyruvate reductase